jgi:hypothetical protein
MRPRCDRCSNPGHLRNKHSEEGKLQRSSGGPVPCGADIESPLAIADASDVGSVDSYCRMCVHSSLIIVYRNLERK